MAAKKNNKAKRNAPKNGPRNTPRKRSGDAAGSGGQDAPKAAPKKFSGGPINRLTLVRSMIRRLKSELESEEGSKNGVAELIRLIALERELAGETENVREIKVTWVEPKAA